MLSDTHWEESAACLGSVEPLVRREQSRKRNTEEHSVAETLKAVRTYCFSLAAFNLWLFLTLRIKSNFTSKLGMLAGSAGGLYGCMKCRLGS